METEKIDRAIEFYQVRKKHIMEYLNKSNELTEEFVISYGEELRDLDLKIWALKLAKNN